MSRNVSEAPHSSGEITSNIAGVAQAAENTSRGAGDTQKAAQQLVETAGRNSPPSRAIQGRKARRSSQPAEAEANNIALDSQHRGGL